MTRNWRESPFKGSIGRTSSERITAPECSDWSRVFTGSYDYGHMVYEYINKLQGRQI